VAGKESNAGELASVRSGTGSILPLTFFERPAVRIARDLLGKKIVRSRGEARMASTIVETEAYEGVHDLASHSSKGRTSRTEVMFGPAGRFYVYRIYGLHWMLNVVTGADSNHSSLRYDFIEILQSKRKVQLTFGAFTPFRFPFLVFRQFGRLRS